MSSLLTREKSHPAPASGGSSCGPADWYWVTRSSVPAICKAIDEPASPDPCGRKPRPSRLAIAQFTQAAIPHQQRHNQHAINAHPLSQQRIGSRRYCQPDQPSISLRRGRREMATGVSPPTLIGRLHDGLAQFNAVNITRVCQQIFAGLIQHIDKHNRAGRNLPDLCQHRGQRFVGGQRSIRPVPPPGADVRLSDTRPSRSR